MRTNAMGQDVTNLRCERVYDLGCEWFCELDNEQNSDLRPRNRGGLFLRTSVRGEERSLFIGVNIIVGGR